MYVIAHNNNYYYYVGAYGVPAGTKRTVFMLVYAKLFVHYRINHIKAKGVNQIAAVFPL